MNIGVMREHMVQKGPRYVAKKAFPTKDAALKALIDTTSHAYQCSICGKWHIGRPGK